MGRSRQTGQTSGPQEQHGNEVLGFHSPPIFQAGCWRSRKLKLPEVQTNTSQGPGKGPWTKAARLTALPGPSGNPGAPRPPPPRRPRARLHSRPHRTVGAHPALHQGDVPEGKLDTWNVHPCRALMTTKGPSPALLLCVKATQWKAQWSRGYSLRCPRKPLPPSARTVPAGHNSVQGG